MSRDHFLRAVRATSPVARAVTFASVALLAFAACGSPLPPVGDELESGTWGGVEAGVIVNDTVAHVHVGCTYGNFPAPVDLDDQGRLRVAGSYMLRAYPVAVGPEVPAEMTGTVRGDRLTFTVVVDDTVEKAQVTLGPATVRLGAEPQMGPCPICVVPRR